MVFDETHPASELFDPLTGRDDPLLQGPILGFQCRDPLPGLVELVALMPFALHRHGVVLGALAALAPQDELRLERFDQTLELGEGVSVRPCVR